SISSADASANRDIGMEFPTIKFLFKDKSKAPIDYQEARSVIAIIKLLNKQFKSFMLFPPIHSSGTFRAPG
ncbi:uncharacterized protein VP01_14088g1, partial [Puccinia sorghi]